MEEQKFRRRDCMDVARMIVEGEAYSDEENMEEEGIPALFLLMIPQYTKYTDSKSSSRLAIV